MLAVMEMLAAFKSNRSYRLLGCLIFLVGCVMPVHIAIGASKPLPVLGRVVELPPYVVEEPLDPPWRYATIPGVEVISRCQDSITSQLIDRHHRLSQLLSMIFPPELQPQRDTPFHYVYYPQSNQPQVTREIVEQAQSSDSSAGADRSLNRIDESLFRFMPNFRFVDPDSIAVFFVVNEFSVERNGFTLTPDYLRYLLDGSTPSLPRWFIEGLMELYPTIQIIVPPITTPLNAQSTNTSRANNSFLYDDAVFSSAIWISREQTRQLKKDPGSAPQFIPLGELFSDIKFETHDTQYQEMWLAESALFIRWALDPEKDKIKAVASGHLRVLESKYTQPQALWRFVARTRAEPVSEELFEECFGQTFADAELRLLDYLRRAISSKFYLQNDNAIDTPAFTLRDATKLDISRIKGELTRLEIGYIQARYPKLTNRYVEQARRTLRVAYDKGERDPRLLAELGLCECDAENDAGAEPFLRAAVQGHVIKPMVYVQLARIELKRLTETVKKEKPTAGQLSSIMNLLDTARHQAPPLSAVYELYARAWVMSELPLDDDEFAILNEGMRYFPRQTGLIYASALLHAMHGWNEQAQALIKRGLNISSDTAEHAALQRLQKAVLSHQTAP